MPADAGKKKSLAREYLEALLIAAIFLGFSNTFLIKTFYIPSSSMENTLLIGDRLFVNRFIYGPSLSALDKVLLPQRDIRRGDVVIFRSPKTPETDLVKRCIGIPGDRVRVIDKKLFINDVPVDDSSFAIHQDPRIYSNRRLVDPQFRARDNFGPFLVPEGHYFFLGDNRDRSYDSRYWGTVPKHLIKGRALLIYWSYGGETPDGKWHGIRRKLAQLGKTVLGFPTKTRWGRSFRLIR